MKISPSNRKLKDSGVKRMREKMEPEEESKKAKGEVEEAEPGGVVDHVEEEGGGEVHSPDPYRESPPTITRTTSSLSTPTFLSAGPAVVI